MGTQDDKALKQIEATTRRSKLTVGRPHKEMNNNGHLHGTRQTIEQPGATRVGQTGQGTTSGRVGDTVTNPEHPYRAQGSSH